MAANSSSVMPSPPISGALTPWARIWRTIRPPVSCRPPQYTRSVLRRLELGNERGEILVVLVDAFIEHVLEAAFAFIALRVSSARPWP